MVTSAAVPAVVGTAMVKTACLGSALLAAVGIGLYGSAAEAARAAVKIKGKYAPSGADYSAAYRRFCELDGVINK